MLILTDVVVYILYYIWSALFYVAMLLCCYVAKILILIGMSRYDERGSNAISCAATV
jgi:hypothetical protein